MHAPKTLPSRTEAMDTEDDSKPETRVLNQNTWNVTQTPLSLYYQSIFPIETLCFLLEQTDPIRKHEIAFEGAFFKRYNSFSSVEASRDFS